MQLAKTFVAACCLAALAGCATRQYSIAPETFTPLPFNETEYAALAKSGTGIVRGQAFGKTVGGDVKKGAGEAVVMFPATTFGTLRYNEQVVGGKLAAFPEDSRYAAFSRTKTTDGDGRFEFTNVPPGTYYIVSRVTWAVVRVNSLGTYKDMQGGNVHQRVTVKDGEITEAMLTLH